MQGALGRRDFLRASGAAVCVSALEGCAAVRPGRMPAGRVSLPPMRVSVDGITRVTVCTRPFRAAGPRLDVETIGQQRIVHNYGHGGSGWSLSWGSSTIAARNAVATGARDIAVIGCGALGLTSAILAQRAGLRVTIYAKDRPPNVRSSLATGLWTPDSRICLEENASAAFKRSWEEMCRTSFAAYQNYLGRSGDAVERIDTYALGDDRMEVAAEAGVASGAAAPRFAELQRDMVPDLMAQSENLPRERNPFPTARAVRSSRMMFNLTGYMELLIAEFMGRGGRIETRRFDSPSQFAELPQKTLINCTGYGARALFGDETITPVRGQLARLMPQPELHYSVAYRGTLLVPRRDGLAVQALGRNDGFGFGDDTTAPDPAEAMQAVQIFADLAARMRAVA